MNLYRVYNCYNSRAHGYERFVILPRLVGIDFGIWIGLGLVCDLFRLWSSKVVRQLLISRLLGSHYSQDCKVITPLICGKFIRQSFGLSGLLDPVPFSELIFGLSFCRINSHNN
jgi:hypothetical protein